MPTPLISIIIPVYNVEKYLRQCLDSVLAQSYKDWECILVDDGSKDSSGKICDEYAAKYDSFSVYHIDNHGASHARNVGIEHATGEWISFLDADDWVTDDYLATINEGFEEDIVFFCTHQIYENGDFICRCPKACACSGRTEVEAVLYNLKYSYLGDIFGWTWDKFLKRSIIEEHHIRFVEDIVVREDEIFTMDYCKYATSIRVSDKLVHYYRVRGDGLTGNGMLDSDYLNLADNIERNLPYFHHEEFLKKEKQRLVDYHVQAFWNKCHWGNINNSTREIRSFFKNKPEYKNYISGRTTKIIVKLLSYPQFVSTILISNICLLKAIYLRLK